MTIGDVQVSQAVAAHNQFPDRFAVEQLYASKNIITDNAITNKPLVGSVPANASWRIILHLSISKHQKTIRLLIYLV